MISTTDTIRVFISLTIKRRNGRPLQNRGPKTRTCCVPLPAPGVGD